MTTSNNTATSKKATPFYIRAGRTAGSDSIGNFELEGIPCTILVDSAGNIAVHKNTKKGYSVKPVATGIFKASTQTGSKAPTLVGTIATAKGSRFRLAAWLHDDAIDPYYVVRYDVTARAGSLFRIQ